MLSSIFLLFQRVITLWFDQTDGSSLTESDYVISGINRQMRTFFKVLWVDKQSKNNIVIWICLYLIQYCVNILRTILWTMIHNFKVIASDFNVFLAQHLTDIYILFWFLCLLNEIVYFCFILCLVCIESEHISYLKQMHYDF